MSDVRTRLVNCFAAVFPELAPADIERASHRTVAAWDSLGNVTLLGAVEDEFGVEIPIEDLETLSSFELLLDYLRTDLNVR
jgi:acyl carrier protein